MMRFSRLQTRLIVTFLAATLLPLGLTLWVGIALLNRSLDLTPIAEFDQMSKAFETLGRDYYQRSRDQLRADIARGEARPEVFPLAHRDAWPANVAEFWEAGAPERFGLAGTAGDRLQLMVRQAGGVALYVRDLSPVRMQELARRFTLARAAIERAQARDLRRGFVWTLIAVSGGGWVAGLAALMYGARRLGKPVHDLTRALQMVAAGDLTHRLDFEGEDEVGAAGRAFNEM